jgi:surface-anchored protein
LTRNGFGGQVRRVRALAPLIGAALLVATAAPIASAAQWNGRLVLDVGHVDAVHVTLDGERLSVRLREDVTGSHVVHAADDVVLHVTNAAKFAVPDVPGFEFLGPVGASTWLIPEVQNSEVVWAGWDTEEIDPGQLQNDALTMELTEATGPGSVHIFNNGPVGEALMVFDPQAGPHTAIVPVNAHAHANWAFSAPGRYELTFEASAVTAAGTSVKGSASYQFVVGDLPAVTEPDPSASPTSPSPTGPSPAAPGSSPTGSVPTGPVPTGAVPTGPSPTGPVPTGPAGPSVGGPVSQSVRASIPDEGGGLVLSVDPRDRVVVLPAAVLAPSGGYWLSRGRLRAVRVTDTRSGSPGWNVVGRVGSFSGGVGEFGGRYLGWTPKVSVQTVDRAVVAGAVVVPGAGSGVGLGRSATLGSVASGSGRGVAVLGAGLVLKVPAVTAAGRYDATLTLTVI